MVHMVRMVLKEYDVKGKYEHDDLMHEHGMEWNDYVQRIEWICELLMMSHEK
jgi:hypothetical protein